METLPSLFDWVRWVEVPIWVGILVLLLKHMQSDARIEKCQAVKVAEHEVKVTGLEARMTRVEDILDHVHGLRTPTEMKD